MSRQRHVFPRDEVSHLWAHGLQDSARDASSSFYFTGGTLYSYGSHFVIAHILRGEEYKDLNGFILWNDATYSNNTSKHQSIAFRALTSGQRDRLLRMPSINYDVSRDIDRAIREKKLPNAAETLLSVIQSKISGLTGKRHGSGPFVDLLFTARKYETTAKALYKAAGRKYPLQSIPESNDDIPADKTARNEFIRGFSAAVIRLDLANARQAAGHYLKQCERNRGDGFDYSDPRETSRVMAGSYDVAQRGIRECEKAQRFYAMLHPGKIDPQARKIKNQLQPMAQAFESARAAAEKEIIRDAFAHLVRRYYSENRKHHETAGKHERRMMPIPGTMKNGANARDALEVLGYGPDSVEAGIVRRIGRIESVPMINRAEVNFRRALESAESYASGTGLFIGDAMSTYQRAVADLKQIERNNSGYARYVLKRLEPLAADARAKVETYRLQQIEKEKARIADWISGASNVKPGYLAGTYARIHGDMVETSRGASVPIEHACRLARVYNRIVSAGGKSWPDGAGPMVGHYRVNHIGADGALIIGCHEFSPEEARRLRDVMASCADCATVNAETV